MSSELEVQAAADEKPELRGTKNTFVPDTLVRIEEEITQNNTFSLDPPIKQTPPQGTTLTLN